MLDRPFEVFNEAARLIVSGYPVVTHVPVVGQHKDGHARRHLRQFTLYVLVCPDSSVDNFHVISTQILELCVDAFPENTDLNQKYLLNENDSWFVVKQKLF